jgi:hypothetical protein
VFFVNYEEEQADFNEGDNRSEDDHKNFKDAVPKQRNAS